MARWAVELAVPSIGGLPLATFLINVTGAFGLGLVGVILLDRGRPGLAAGYWLATLMVGQMAGVYGMWLGRIRLPRRRHGVERRGPAASDLHR